MLLLLRLQEEYGLTPMETGLVFAPGFIVFILLPAHAHRVTDLTDVLGAENTAARNGAGWDVCLSALDARARGERFEGAHAGPTELGRELYEAYVAAGVPSGAPIPGADGWRPRRGPRRLPARGRFVTAG
ncbi:hypothetical protein [Streptomyces composti]|uniref:hypothetical protein n=1 Tax=Streptomyces composti TaxID=2720025 RepID=UPI00359C150B